MIEFVVVGFSIILGLYVAMRLSGRPRRSPTEADVRATSTGKLHYSKVHDSGFFDGASEDYSEALSRNRQFGGA